MEPITAKDEEHVRLEVDRAAGPDDRPGRRYRVVSGGRSRLGHLGRELAQREHLDDVADGGRSPRRADDRRDAEKTPRISSASTSSSPAAPRFSA